MSREYKRTPEQRAYFREYMRQYRLVGATTPQRPRRHRRHASPEEQAKNHARYLRTREKRLARSRAYALAHPEQQRQWQRESRERTRPHCAFCGAKTYEGVVSCMKCRNEFGNCCQNNPACGVSTPHKHCPCGMPVIPQTNYRQIQPCPICAAEMAVAGLSLAELFQRADELEEAA